MQDDTLTFPEAERYDPASSGTQARFASTSAWKDQIFWFILSLLFAYGVINNFLPVTFPIFKHLFHASLEELGRTQLLFFIAGLFFSMLGGWFVDRFGLKRATVVTLVCSSCSMVFIGAAKNFQLVLVGSFLFGIAVAALVVVYSAMICECYPRKRQFVFLISGAVGGVGGVLGPAAQGKWLLHAERTGANWGAAYYLAAGCLGLLIIWAIFLRSGALPPHRSNGGDVLGPAGAMKNILGRPALYAIGLVYLLHGVGQSGMLAWVGQFYQGRHPINSAQAAYFISLELVGVLVGRSVLSWITARWNIPDLLLLSVCSAATTVAFIATLISGSYIGGLIGFTVAGFFVAGNGPAISSFIGLRFSDQMASAFAILGGIGNIGSAGGPYLVGFLGAKFGLGVAIWLLPISMLGLTVVAFGWFLRTNRHYRKSTCQEGGMC